MFVHTMGLLYLKPRVWLVCVFFLFFSTISKKIRAIAATGMHWSGAERTAPLNAPSLSGSTKPSLGVHVSRGEGRGQGVVVRLRDGLGELHGWWGFV